MANPDGKTLEYHRRLALESMPPSELRDDYLLYLDDLDRRAARAEAAPPRPEPAPAPPAADGRVDGSGWTLQRYVLAAIGSVAFAYGTWALTSLS